MLIAELRQQQKGLFNLSEICKAHDIPLWQAKRVLMYELFPRPAITFGHGQRKYYNKEQADEFVKLIKERYQK